MGFLCHSTFAHLLIVLLLSQSLKVTFALGMQSFTGSLKICACLQVSQLEEEASEMFERCSGLEDELGAVQAQAHLHAQALATAQAELEVYTAA